MRAFDSNLFVPVCLASTHVSYGSIRTEPVFMLLGQSAAFSGPAQMLGIQMNLGAKLYFDSINAQGGVHGRKIAIQTTDDTYEASTAAENARSRASSREMDLGRPASGAIGIGRRSQIR